MIEDKKIFKNQDLVLKITPNIDPEKFDINPVRSFGNGFKPLPNQWFSSNHPRHE